MKNEWDGSNEYNQYQHGALNTSDQFVKDVANYEVVFHIGDLSYANGYISEWDQFTEQVHTIASTVHGCQVPSLWPSSSKQPDKSISVSRMIWTNKEQHIVYLQNYVY